MGKMQVVSQERYVPGMGKKPQKEGLLKELVKNRVLFLMLLPGVILLIINNYIPMVGVLLAFKNFKQYTANFFLNFWKSEWVGLQNFKFFTDTPDAFNYTRNTILYNLTFIILGLVLSVFFAVALNELKNRKLSKLYQTTMFLPYFLSWVVVGYLVFAFLSEEKGFIDKTLLPSLGMESISWYAEPKYWPFILTGVQLWKMTGYNSVVYLAAIAGIDTEYYEAATVDGASKWQQIRKITLPLLTPLMTIMTLLAVGKIFCADFGLFFNIPRNVGALYDTTQVIDTAIYNSLQNLGDIGMSSAVGLYQAAIGFFLVLGTNYVVRKIDPEKALF